MEEGDGGGMMRDGGGRMSEGGVEGGRYKAEEEGRREEEG